MKYILRYVAFSLISLLIAIVLSAIFQFSLTNTWQAAVAMIFVFGPYLVLGWRCSTKIYDEHFLLSFILRILIILIVLGYLLSTHIVL